MIKAIVFDLWKTLATKNSVTSALRERFQLESGPDFTRVYEEVVQREYWRDLEGLASHVLDRYGVDNSSDNRSFVASTFGSATEQAQLYPGTRKMLHQLYPYYKLGLLSNTTPAEVLRPEWDIEKYFSAIVYSYQHGDLKPSRESFARVCDQLEVPFSDCLFIDDTLNNVQAARKYGLEAIQFVGMPELREEMRKYGIFVD